METVVRLGKSLFVNADCVRGALDHLADGSVDLLVSDPPYGIRGDKLHQHYNRDEAFVIDGYIEVPAAQYNAFSHGWIAQAERVLRPGGALYVVSGYTNLYDVLDALRATSLREVNHIIWKYNFGVYTSTKYVSSHYHVLYYEKPGGKRTFNVQARYAHDAAGAAGGSPNYRDREDVWTINREYKPGRRKNKNELPPALLEKIIQYSSNEGDVVCDFFFGGGSTAAGAIGLNRQFVGFEASAATFAAGVQRLREVRPGSRLAHAITATPRDAENRGKSWEPDDVRRALARFEQLRDQGQTKKAAVATLCEEFGRGPWAVANVLKRYAAPLHAAHAQPT